MESNNFEQNYSKNSSESTNYLNETDIGINMNNSRDIILPHKDHFPLSIVWCPLPGLTWFIPIIGHLGIVTSDGTIHDFAGPYFVNRNPHSMGFGHVTKYAPLDIKDIRRYDSDLIKVWDENINAASEEYDQLMHNLICNNCHSHVARVLNRLQYKGFTHWNTLTLI